jgi:hypothetical protein
MISVLVHEGGIGRAFFRTAVNPSMGAAGKTLPVFHAPEKCPPNPAFFARSTVLE